MSKEIAIQNALCFFDDGHILRGLNKLIGIQTESQDPEKIPLLYEYIETVIPQIIEPLGFNSTVYDNPVRPKTN
jgi:hypothetical protein